MRHTSNRPAAATCGADFARGPRPASAAFTLVELLVVIAIIGILVGLLLPAVQSAREAGRRSQCQNNLKQLVTAMTNYDSSQSKLPGLVNELPNQGSQKTPNGVFLVGRRASWLVMAFPYLEEQPLWDRWTTDFTPGDSQNGSIDASFTPVIGAFQCPSDPPEIPDAPALSYVGNAGWSISDPDRGNDPLEYAANGVFFDLNRRHTNNPGSGWINQLDVRDNANAPVLQMSLDYIQSGDGTTKTMMVGENTHAFAYTFPVNEQNLPDAKRYFGFVWSNEPIPNGVPAVNPTNLTAAAVQRINGGLAASINSPQSLAEMADNGNGSQDAGDWLAFPSSNHPGGVDVAFCDGRVQFVAESIDRRVYAQGMTTKSKRSRYRDITVTPQTQQLDRFLPQPTDADF